MSNMDQTPILEARNVSKSFGKFKALNDVSTRFMPGTITAIIGPNGAGKAPSLMSSAGHSRPLADKFYLMEKISPVFHSMNLRALVFLKAFRSPMFSNNCQFMKTFASLRKWKLRAITF